MSTYIDEDGDPWVDCERCKELLPIQQFRVQHGTKMSPHCIDCRKKGFASNKRYQQNSFTDTYIAVHNARRGSPGKSLSTEYSLVDYLSKDPSVAILHAVTWDKAAALIRGERIDHPVMPRGGATRNELIDLTQCDPV